MTIGVVGLGLIGGSFAKTYHEAGATVFAYNRSKAVLDFAELSGVVDGELTIENISGCDLVILTLYPEASIEQLERFAPYIGAKPLVIDACGTKRNICESGFKLAEEHGFTFVGCHPMAGTHFSGYKYSKADMFKGASMVVVPPVFDDIELLSRVKKLLEPCEFGRYSVTTAADHDQMIAFTSQLNHVVAQALIKSPSAERARGFAGGSFRDMTRVAYLNAKMWAEIYMDNSDYLLDEIDGMIAHLKEYRDAIEAGDVETLTRILQDGTDRKERLG